MSRLPDRFYYPSICFLLGDYMRFEDKLPTVHTITELVDYMIEKEGHPMSESEREHLIGRVRLGMRWVESRHLVSSKLIISAKPPYNTITQYTNLTRQ